MKIFWTNKANREYCRKYNIRPMLGGCGGDDSGDDGRAAYEKATKPQVEHQEQMNKLFKETYDPYARSQYDFYQQYGKPMQETQARGFQEIFPNLLSEAKDPFLNLEPVFSDIWKRTRQKTAEQFAPIEQRTSQRLAGAGALGSGAALKMFSDIETKKFKSNETLAMEQAIQEFNVQQNAKQQAYSNLFQGLGYQPGIAERGNVMSSVGSYNPEIIPPYIEPKKERNWITGAKSGPFKMWSDIQFGSSPEQAMQTASTAAMLASSSIRYKKNIKLWAKH